jgi:hypothetical protein
VADALDIHVTTARFHLTTPERLGAVRRGGDARSGGVGRPRLTYEPAPRLDYADIVALFATHLGGTPTEREEWALRIGADLAHRVRLTEVTGDPPWWTSLSVPWMIGFQQGLIQEVIDANVASTGRGYTVAVHPDPHRGSCEVGLILSPSAAV